MSDIKIVRTFENCFNIIKDLYENGISVCMSNHRRWVTSSNDNAFMSDIDLPDIQIEVRGNKSFYHKYTDLDILCEFLELVLEEIQTHYINNNIGEQYRFNYEQYLTR